MSYKPAVLASLLTLLTAQASDAFPVDFVLTEPGNRKQPAPQVQEAEAEEVKDTPVEAKDEAADAKAADAARPAAKAQPVKRGIVRQKAAAVAEGAAGAAEEVGQVLGALLGGLFGRRGGQVVANVKVDENAVKQFEAQFGRHFDQVIKTELHFIRIVCQLTREQYGVMANDGELIRSKTVNKFALLQQGMNRGVRSSTDTDMRKPISEGLLLSAKRHLTPDQVAKYESELAERKHIQKEVGVLVTTAKLDRKLVLNTNQRAQVKKVLSENLNASQTSAQLLMYGGDHFPNVPDRKLTPILSETQKKVWRTVNQQSQVFFGFNAGMIQGLVIADEKWDDKPADDEPADDEAKNEGDSATGKNVKESLNVDEKTAPVATNGKTEASE